MNGQYNTARYKINIIVYQFNTMKFNTIMYNAIQKRPIWKDHTTASSELAQRPPPLNCTVDSAKSAAAEGAMTAQGRTNPQP